MQTYSESFKRKMVQRMLVPSGPSASALSKEVGIPQPTLSRWRSEFGTMPVMPTKKRNRRPPPAPTPTPAGRSRRPEDWTALDRLAAVIEAAQLSGDELGAFLRREGLHEETLVAWRSAALEALQPSSARARERAGEKKELVSLKRDLARKDRALAETAALLILKKKAAALWGDEDDDTPKENDR